MKQLSRITFFFVLLIALALYSGLDKFYAFFYFFLLLFVSERFNWFSDWFHDPETRFKWLSKIKYLKNSSDNKRFLNICFHAFLLIILLVILNQLYFFVIGTALSAYEPVEFQAIYLISTVIILYFTLYARRTLEQENQVSFLFRYFRLCSYLAVVHFLIFALSLSSFFVASNARIALIQICDYSFFAIFLYLSLITLEMIFRLFNTIFTKPYEGKLQNHTSYFFIDLFALESSIKKSAILSFEQATGIKLSESKTALFFMQIFEPVLIFALLCVWLLTSIVIVDPNKEVVFYSMGQIVDSKSFGPGIYFKLPWPLTEFELFEVNKIKVLNVGFEPDPAQPHMIWSKQHTLKYFDLLLGDGLEMIGVDCQIFYRIDDCYKYSTTIENPEDYISANAYRILTLEMVDSTFDNIITRDRSLLAEYVKNNLQAILDQKEIGVKIVEVIFLAIHPPLGAIDDFEDVISSEIDAVTKVLDAQTERSLKVSMNEALSTTSVLEASAYAVKKVSDVKGESIAMLSNSHAYSLDPALFRFMLRQDYLQKMLLGKRIFVFDEALLSHNSKVFLNLD